MLRFGHEDEANGSDLSPVDFVDRRRAGSASRPSRVDGFGPDYQAALTNAVAARAPRLLHVRARLYPPVSTSPRWPAGGSSSGAGSHGTGGPDRPSD